MDPRGRRWSFLPLNTLPRALNVVWSHFPTSENPDVPNPEPHPALVRSLALNKAQTAALIEVNFGTSNLKIDQRPFDLIIQNSASLDHAGLYKATRFDLDRTEWLPWASEWFRPREGYSTPIIGELDESTRSQLEALKVARRIHTKR